MNSSAFHEYPLAGRFADLRQTLDSERYCQHLDQPLALWSLPTDRHLPLAFLNRTLRDLLKTPFSELAATPGIGEKKMGSLVKLLSRAVSTKPEDLSFDVTLPLGAAEGNDRFDTMAASDTPKGAPDPDQVSEVTWRKWQASVIALGLESEPLGRLTSSLRDLPSASWAVPLEKYIQPSLGEIRQMKTHGRKRVRAIVEVFHSVHEIALGTGTMEHLAMQLCPRRIAAVRQWVEKSLQASVIPATEEILNQFIRPMLDQLEIDATDQSLRLARHRLGIDGPAMTVRDASREMELTRARVYQLLNIVNDVLILRWPGGRRLVHELGDHFVCLADTDSELEPLTQFFAAAELFYPRRRRLAMIVSQGPRQQSLGS